MCQTGGAMHTHASAGMPWGAYGLRATGGDRSLFMRVCKEAVLNEGLSAPGGPLLGMKS